MPRPTHPYLRTWEGWLYLASCSTCSRGGVVGWALHDRITRQLALDALTMALRIASRGPGLVHHSDRGSQYASGDYQAAARRRTGSCAA